MRGHSPALDGLRGVAILLVLARHVSVGSSADWPSRLVDFVRNGGWLGVDLFFVLSGFLITGVLLDARGSEGYFRNFYGRRVLRIWPLYYLTLAFAFLVAPHLRPFGWPMGPIGSQIFIWPFFLQNIADVLRGPPYTPFNAIWSLAVEEQVYLLLPAVVLLCTRGRLALVFLLSGVLALGFRLLSVELGLPANAQYELTPARLDSFAVGGLLALLARKGEGLHRYRRGALGAGAAAGAALLGVAVFSPSGFDYGEPPMDTWGFTLAAIFFGSWLWLALASRRLAHWLSCSVLRRFGQYSYAIYLIHLPVWTVLGPRLWAGTLLGSRLPAQLFAWVLMLGISLALGWLSWNLIERHALALKRYFRSGEPHMPSRRRAEGAEALQRVGVAEVDAGTRVLVHRPGVTER